MSLFLLYWHSHTYRRSEVVGRPLAALLANDGARVLSVDIDCMSVPVYGRKELISSNPGILKTTLVINYSIQIKPPPPHHTHHPYFGRLSEHLGCSHLSSPIAILQSPNQGPERWLCLCQCCWWKELWDGCKGTCKFLPWYMLVKEEVLTARHQSTYLVWVWWQSPCCNETCTSTLLLERQVLMIDCVYVRIRICLKRSWAEHDPALSPWRSHSPCIALQ